MVTAWGRVADSSVKITFTKPIILRFLNVYYNKIRCAMYYNRKASYCKIFKCKEKSINGKTVKYKWGVGRLSAVCFGKKYCYKSLLLKNITSLVHAQTHNLAKLWFHKNTRNNKHKEQHRIYTSELF